MPWRVAALKQAKGGQAKYLTSFVFFSLMNICQQNVCLNAIKKRIKQQLQIFAKRATNLSSTVYIALN